MSTTTLLHLLIIFIFSVFVSVRCQCLLDQCSFLLQFRHDLSLNAFKLQTWTRSSDCCSWGGVTCNLSGHVIALDLSEEWLSGVINDSSALFSLHHLEHLNLAYSDFQGQKMPTKFNKFVNLNYLNLFNSGFIGQIPLEISNLTSLTFLDLSSDIYHRQNQTLEVLDLRKLVHNLSSLTELYLDGVDMSSSKGNEWSRTLSSSTPNLRILSLSRCQLSGPFDSSLQNLRFLSDINLSNNNLSSPIPEFLSNLSNLTSLILSDSGLQGTIQENIFQVRSLKILDLSHNNFTGLVPSLIAALKELTILDLSFNNLNGPISLLSSLKSLERMVLSGNKFSGSISSTNWDELANLTYLFLNENSFSGEIPSSLFGRNIEVNLSHNQLTALPNEFPELSSLQLIMLDLSCNKIKGRLPSWIWEMKNLEILNISHNFLEDIGHAFKRLNSKLVILDLHDNRIQGEIQSVPSFSLYYIDYSNNNFRSVIPTSFFQNLNKIMTLLFSNNNFEGIIPHSICNLSLTLLDLSNNSLDGEIPKCLFESRSSLQALKLSSNKLTGPIPDKFANDSKLEYVDLRKNRLEGKIPRSMSNCKSLQFFNLEKNQLNDVFPVHLMDISALQVLGLQSNKLHGSIDCSTKNGSWPNLHIINIGSNNFSGEIPENCLRNWIALMVVQNYADPLGFFKAGALSTSGAYFYEAYATTTKGQEMELSKVSPEYASIDFSCNNFRGKISKVIGELKGLRNLNLSHNALSGEISASIGKLKDLESMDFSRNNLSGAIPSEIASMSFLAYADFSYNQLVGQIPIGTQLQSFPSSYFEGNPRLCGPPLKTNCLEQNPPTKELDDHSNSTSGIEWSFISIEVGFTFGLGVVILPITFSRRWRVFFYRHVERVLFKILPRLDPRNYVSRKSQVGNLQNLRRQ